MPSYKVYGSKVTSFYTVVAASNPTEAYEIANARESLDWDEVETDNVIEITDVIESEDVVASVQEQLQY